jgi:hypothetical protein
MALSKQTQVAIGRFIALDMLHIATCPANAHYFFRTDLYSGARQKSSLPH